MEKLKKISFLLFFPIFLQSQTDFIDMVQSITREIEQPKRGLGRAIPAVNPFISIDKKLQRNTPKPPANVGCHPFNIQTASVSDFTQIDGIDRFLAKNIVTYRNRYGFRSVDELRKVWGIDDLLFTKIANYILNSQECLKEKKKRVKKRKKRFGRTLRLEAILNDRVKISNRWYKKGDRVGRYIVQNIDLDSVQLSNRYSKKVLKFSTSSKRHISIEIR